MLKRSIIFWATLSLSFGANAQEWDSVVGDTLTVGETDPHWVSVRGQHKAYLVDADAGEVAGILTLSMFSPAVRPHMDKGRIYSYGSYYSRTYYGDRTDIVLVFDANTTEPVAEIEIPAKSAGIGHSGMIGLINDRFVGVWNITPGMSVSLVDTEDNSFLREISTPGCSGVFPLDEGFLMTCADGNLQYIELDDNGDEVVRERSREFFNVIEDPVYDYAVPSGEGWIFMSLEGQVYEATLDGDRVEVSEPWSINPPDDESRPDLNGIVIEPDDNWRIGGRQPFAFNAETGILVTVMHEGGGQETFEDAGTEIWGFNWNTKRRGYRLEMEGDTRVSSVQLTQDDEPLLIVGPSGADLQVREARSGALLREIKDLSGGLIQNLHP